MKTAKIVMKLSERKKAEKIITKWGEKLTEAKRFLDLWDKVQERNKETIGDRELVAIEFEDKDLHLVLKGVNGPTAKENSDESIAS